MKPKYQQLGNLLHLKMKELKILSNIYMSFFAEFSSDDSASFNNSNGAMINYSIKDTAVTINDSATVVFNTIYNGYPVNITLNLSSSSVMVEFPASSNYYNTSGNWVYSDEFIFTDIKILLTNGMYETNVPNSLAIIDTSSIESSWQFILTFDNANENTTADLTYSGGSGNTSYFTWSGLSNSNFQNYNFLYFYFGLFTILSQTNSGAAMNKYYDIGCVFLCPLLLSSPPQTNSQLVLFNDPNMITNNTYNINQIGNTSIYAKDCIITDGIGEWFALGSDGLTGICYSLIIYGTDLYVGGDFIGAGGKPAPFIAVYDTSKDRWSSLGKGLNGLCYALAISGTTLYAGGVFTMAGGNPANNIAMYDISTRVWYPLDSGINGSCCAIAILGTNLYAGGSFYSVGDLSANNIAMYNASGWSALGSGVNLVCSCLAVSEKNLYVGGGFGNAGEVPARFIAMYNTTNGQWSGLGSGLNNLCNALYVSGANLYVGGDFTIAGGVSANYIAVYNTSGWYALGSGLNSGCYALDGSGTTIYAGGDFTIAGDISANNIAMYDTSWKALGSGLDNKSAAIAISETAIYTGGLFQKAGDAYVNSIARYTYDYINLVFGNRTINTLFTNYTGSLVTTNMVNNISYASVSPVTVYQED